MAKNTKNVAKAVVASKSKIVVKGKTKTIDPQNPPEGYAKIKSEAGIKLKRNTYAIPDRVRVTILGHSATSIFKAMAQRTHKLNGELVHCYNVDDGRVIGQSKLASAHVAADSTVTTAFTDAKNPTYTGVGAQIKINEILADKAIWLAIDKIIASAAKLSK